MSSRDKTQIAATDSSRPVTSKAARRTISSSSSKTNQQQQFRLTKPSTTTSTSANSRRGKKDSFTPLDSTAAASGKLVTRNSISKDHQPVINSSQQTSQGSEPPKESCKQNRLTKRGKTSDQNDETSSSSQEMTMTNLNGNSPGSSGAQPSRNLAEKETNIDRPHQQSETDDDESITLLESCSSDIIGNLVKSELAGPGASATLPTPKSTRIINEPLEVLYHDDEEINMSSPAHLPRRTSSDESEYLESGAALTAADDPTTMSDVVTFAVYPTGSCEFDETQLISTQCTKSIQKCILRLSSHGAQESMEPVGRSWGLDPTQPILMRLLDDHIQFSDIDTHTLLRSQPIQTIKTWAVDDDNNFAFVVEDQHDSTHANRLDLINDQAGSTSMYDSVDYALLNGPTFMCYVFSSIEDDDMSIKVATKLNAVINRYRELMSNRVSKSTRFQQVETNPVKRVVAQGISGLFDNDQTDVDGDDFDDAISTIDDNIGDDLEEPSEMTLRVKYIGKVQVPRPMGIDVLNVAIDKSLADASKAQMDRLLSSNNRTGTSTSPITSTDGQLEIGSPLTEAKIHVSPSSVIIENEQTGDIIVECRIRYLTFMGISRRDIRWCGFIMQNTTNKTFEAHCIESSPTAGHVCEAIQASCSRMYQKMVKGQRRKQQLDEAISIMPRTSKIRDTLAKTLSKIKLAPIIQ